MFWFNVGNVQFAKLPELGVPKAGDTKVGEVANTLAPVPVSSVNAANKLADVKDPKDVAFPTEVMCPVRLAFVVTVAALPSILTPVNV